MGMSRRFSRFFTSTRRLCCVKSCIPLLRTQDTFAHYGHVSRTSMTSFKTQVTINNHASTSDFLHGTVHTTLEQLIRMFFDENTHAVANFAFFKPALHYWKGSNTYWLFCAIPVEIKLPISSVWVQESKWQYLLRPHLNAHWAHRLLRKIGFREHLVDCRRHSLSSPTSLDLPFAIFRQLCHLDYYIPPVQLENVGSA